MTKNQTKGDEQYGNNQAIYKGIYVQSDDLDGLCDCSWYTRIIDIWNGIRFRIPNHIITNPIPTVTIGDIKNSASTIPYDDLMRHSDNHIGEIIYKRGEILQVSERRTDDYVLRVATKQSTYGYHEDIIWVNYEGDRLLEGDIIDVWGESKGLETYSALLGNQVTIPEIDSLHVELVTKSGNNR